MRLVIPILAAIVLLGTLTVVINYNWGPYPYVGQGNATVEGVLIWHTGSSSLDITLNNVTSKYVSLPFPYALINASEVVVETDIGSLVIIPQDNIAYMIWRDKSNTPLGYLKYELSDTIYVLTNATRAITYNGYTVYPIEYMIDNNGVNVVINGITYLKIDYKEFSGGMYYGRPPVKVDNTLVLWHTIFKFESTGSFTAIHKG